jgi:transcription initiation factor IIE alpha subunit
MNREDFFGIRFEPAFVEGCEIECTECKQFSLAEEFIETEIYGCELCGTHSGATCPKCGEDIDLVHTDKLITRSPIK